MGVELNLGRQSKSLEEAVRNYKAKYGRNPPKGFDTWYKWAVANDVQVLDDVSDLPFAPFQARQSCRARR